MTATPKPAGKRRFWVAFNIVGLLMGSWLVLFGDDRYEWMWLLLVITSTLDLTRECTALQRQSATDDA